MQKIRYIIIHCSATTADREVSANDINTWHKARGFRKIGYHFVICRNGLIETGRMIDETGAHTRGYNSSSIGICLVGGIDSQKRPETNYTKQQWDALQSLVQTLTLIYPKARVCGHRDMPDVAKSCPCFDAAAWWNKADRGPCYD